MSVPRSVPTVGCYFAVQAFLYGEKGTAGLRKHPSGAPVLSRSGYKDAVSAPVTKPIPLRRRVADRPAVISGQVMPRSVPLGQPRNPHGRRMGEGLEDVGAGRGAPTPHRGAQPQPAAPSPAKLGHRARAV